MVLTISFVLSPVIGLSCHRRLRKGFRKLDASVEAPGPHDFAVRKITRSSAAQLASTASRPASVTIAIRPLVGWDGGGYSFDLGQARNEIFLQKGLDSMRTTPAPNSPTGKSVATPAHEISVTSSTTLQRIFMPWRMTP
jgi:hypothetical protein